MSGRSSSLPARMKKTPAPWPKARRAPGSSWKRSKSAPSDCLFQMELALSMLVQPPATWGFLLCSFIERLPCTRRSDFPVRRQSIRPVSPLTSWWRRVRTTRSDFGAAICPRTLLRKYCDGKNGKWSARKGRLFWRYQVPTLQFLAWLLVDVWLYGKINGWKRKITNGFAEWPCL